MDIERFRVPHAKGVRLADWDPDSTDGSKLDKKGAAEQLPALNDRLGELQQLLYAESKHKVLVVLQGMDTSGKDGTIKHVFRTVNPLGVKVANFKRPNDTELAHDYLWRVHANTPGAGHLTIFNRSHYEDVLVVRVHDLVPEAVWSRRYAHINDFERLLTDEGTVVIKLFLHISKDEQKQRLQERLDNPAKQWKFEHGDIDERKLWDEYQVAYEAALEQTSTEHAPWYVIPANKKWFRNLLISTILIDTLEGLDMHYPDPSPDLEKLKID